MDDSTTALVPQLAQQAPWVMMMAIIVGALVWLTKEGTPTAMLVPARYRLPLAALLGQLAAALQVVALGANPKDAILGGFVASALSWAGHELGIEKLRGGKELGVKPAETRTELRPISPTDETPLPAVAENGAVQASDHPKPE